MQQEQNQKIRFLQNKVKLLEREINERVRSFLLFANKSVKNHTRNLTSDKQTQISQFNQKKLVEMGCQTDQINPLSSQERNLLKGSGISIFESDLESPSIENQKIEEFPHKTNLISLFEAIKENNVQVKQKPEIRINFLQSQQGKQITFSPKIQQQTEESKDLTSSDFYLRERKKMRKEIKKLKEKLDYQTEVSTQAKQGLLISEEENYAFRVNIAQLTKILNQQIHKQTLQLELITRLEEDNKALINKLRDVEHENKQNNKKDQQQPKNQQIQDSLSFIENLKDKLHAISQLLPVEADSADLSMFRPQNQAQIFQVIKKIVNYFQSTQSERDANIELRLKQKKQFIYVLQQISSMIDLETKQNIRRTIKKQSELIAYANVFKT